MATGQVPPQLGMMTALARLKLEGNQLRGETGVATPIILVATL